MMTMPDTDNTAKTGQDKIRDSYGTAVQSASEALQSSREKAAEAARRAGQGVESNPLGVVVGGLAVGALVGALVPRSAKEKELLAPAGQRIGATVRAATQAAREAGMAELDQRGLTKDAVKDQARGLVDGLVKAVGTAAATSAGVKSSEQAQPPQDQSAESGTTGETLDTYQPVSGNYAGV
jgi:ElaB/YqjD/DUF883 family membrane-anchored ribosome-binding protein